MSKEMTSSHRVDVLTDAILYYGQKAKDNIGTAWYAVRSNHKLSWLILLLGRQILKRLEHSQNLSKESENDLKELMEMSPGIYTPIAFIVNNAFNVSLQFNSLWTM